MIKNLNLLSRNVFERELSKIATPHDNWEFIGIPYNIQNHNSPNLFCTILESDIDDQWIHNIAIELKNYLQCKILEIASDEKRFYTLPTYCCESKSGVDLHSYIFTPIKCKTKIPNIHFVRYVHPGDFRCFVNMWVDGGYGIGSSSNLMNSTNID